jgi:hypothetical protein
VQGGRAGAMESKPEHFSRLHSFLQHPKRRTRSNAHPTDPTQLNANPSNQLLVGGSPEAYREASGYLANVDPRLRKESLTIMRRGDQEMTRATQTL